MRRRALASSLSLVALSFAANARAFSPCDVIDPADEKAIAACERDEALLHDRPFQTAIVIGPAVHAITFADRSFDVCAAGTKACTGDFASTTGRALITPRTTVYGGELQMTVGRLLGPFAPGIFMSLGGGALTKTTTPAGGRFDNFGALIGGSFGFSLSTGVTLGDVFAVRVEGMGGLGFLTIPATDTTKNAPVTLRSTYGLFAPRFALEAYPTPGLGLGVFVSEEVRRDDFGAGVYLRILSPEKTKRR